MSAMVGEMVLDPQFAEVVESLGRLDLSPQTLAAARLPRAPVPLSDRVTRTDVIVPGEPDLTLRVHRPIDAAGALPCVFSMHPGGYVLGDVTMDDVLFDRWCVELGLLGVSVGYRLAPDTPYPGPITDCYTGLTWVHEHADELGVDRSRIGVHGVGAGAGLAAALALVARDHRDVALAFQLLDSPMLDDRQQTHTSRLDDLAGWTSKSIEFGWRAYLGDLYGTPDVPGYAAAGRATKLRRLPPAFVSVGARDGLHDEDVDYAVRLNHAGVPTELHVYPGTPHGYQLAADSDVARQSARDKAAWLRRQLSR